MRFKCGNSNALERIYEKYANCLLTIAAALLNDTTEAEDVLHDVFVSFARTANTFKVRGNLKSYLSTCIVNRVRDRLRSKTSEKQSMDEISQRSPDSQEPINRILFDEETQILSRAIATLPYEQREVIAMHLKAGLKFKEIAKLQKASISTVQGRYRYGLNKLRSILDGEVE
ncbi:MAG: RNA polymerase sigma factor [Planctomycetota bacterium]